MSGAWSTGAVAHEELAVSFAEDEFDNLPAIPLKGFSLNQSFEDLESRVDGHCARQIRGSIRAQ